MVFLDKFHKVSLQLPLLVDMRVIWYNRPQNLPRRLSWRVLWFERHCIEISSCPSLVLRDCLDVCSDLENTDCTRKNCTRKIIAMLRIGRVISPQVPWHVLSLADQNRQAPQAQSTHAHHQTISDDFYLAEELILLFVTPTMPEE